MLIFVIIGNYLELRFDGYTDYNRNKKRSFIMVQDIKVETCHFKTISHFLQFSDNIFKKSRVISWLHK